MNNTALTVSQLNFFIKSMFECEPRLQHVAVSGEISNFTEHYKSGHMYFSVKDASSSIKVVMFRSSAQKIKFKPEDGMNVVITGRVSVFERDGQYQLYADNMIPSGTGALAMAFEQLKEKLSKEGLFDVSLKKAIPLFPSAIGVVTAKGGAALRDILNILSRRWPLAEVILCPVLVQGVSASQSVADAVKKLNTLNACDVIIVGRGGGSVEDLWAFNEEILVRSVAESKIPIISAVGHETDFTLCDFAADLRAPTPSAAAELAVPDIYEIQAELNTLCARLNRAVQNKIQLCASEVEKYNRLTGKKRLNLYLENNMQYCDSLTEKLKTAVDRKIEKNQKILAEKATALEALSPLRVLTRGYARCEKNGEGVISINNLEINDTLNVIFSDGAAVCSVNKLKENKL